EPWLLLLGLAAFWGTAFLFNRVAVAEIAPAPLVAVRIATAAVALNLTRMALGLRLPRDRRVWLRFVPVAITGTVLPFLLISWGQERIPSGLAGVLMAISPLATVVLAHFLVDSEPLSGRKLLGVGSGLLGVVVLLGPESLEGLGRGGGVERMLAVLAGAGCYATNTVLTRRIPALHPVVFGSGILLVAAVVSLPLGAFELAHGVHLAGPGAWASVLWLALGPTGFATLLHYRLVRTEGAGFASQVSYAIPVVALLSGAFALGEPVRASALVALALILAGVLAARSSGARPACAAASAAATR
ncbi:MAG: DMT family transporter, partial [Myxococcota bacterium]|nr:DMT family transporter [Myxococcota bacterium]